MNRPSKRVALATSAGLSLLFIVVYGGCNWITAQRSDVGTWYYQWERFIPFVPVMIVPYMSIDLFFVASPFLCGRRSELRTLARRIAFAILVAGVGFLLMPLTMAVPRPQPGGWTGAIFQFLHGFDQPNNLFPSLHITLCLILADIYFRHTKGIVRAAFCVWFVLIGISTLVTWQHHFVDIVGGFVLAVICFYLFREGDTRSAGSPNHRVGLYYAVGTLVAVGVAWLGWPWTGICHWPALGLALIAAGYWGLGPGIYRKEKGRLPLSARLVFAPCLLGQQLSLFHYRRQCAAWNVVTPNLWISAKLNRREAQKARELGLTAVLDLTAEFCEVAALRSLDYKNIALLDLTAPTPEQLRDAVAFISQRTDAGVVCVHCKVGYSRSAAVVGAYLLATDRADSVGQAVDLLRSARPTIVVRPEALGALETYHRAMPKSKMPGLAVI